MGKKQPTKTVLRAQRLFQGPAEGFIQPAPCSHSAILAEWGDASGMPGSHLLGIVKTLMDAHLAKTLH